MCSTCGCSDEAATRVTLVDGPEPVHTHDHPHDHDHDHAHQHPHEHEHGTRTELLETWLDAERIRATGSRVVQINTGAGCHLDAEMLDRGLLELAPPDGSLVFVENVGNLVCPALFDLGESARVVIISVTEGADKPAKYPYMFRTADLVLLNKIDLLPYVDFDVDLCLDLIRRLQPDVELLPISATRGDGLDAWHSWLAAR